jgi:predicted flavoprotein YhiN
VALPRRLAEKVCDLEGVGFDQTCAALTAAQIHRLVERLKNSTFTVTATRGFKEAMVTAGGIPLTEVNPNTYESKIVPNLFLTGEVLDLTGPSGGYNLQLAFSTGHLAGTVIAAKQSP